MRRGPRLAWVALLCFGLPPVATAGRGMPEPTIAADDRVFSDPAHVPHTEVGTTAAIVSPSGQEPGLLFVESGVSLLSRTLSADGVVGDLVPVTLPSPSRPDPSPSVHNQIVRLASGELFLVRQGVATAEVTAPPAAAAAFAQWQSYVGGQRVVLSTWRSSGRGRTWARVGGIDSALVLDGTCAWPQEVDGKPRPGGWDRPEIYVDPWTGNLFLSMGCAAGSAPAFRDHAVTDSIVYSSRDEGTTWKLAARLPRGQPLVMTTTSDGRLYLVSAAGADTTTAACRLAWLDSPYLEVAGKADVSFGDPKKPEHLCALLPSEGLLPRVGQPRDAAPTISRVAGRKGEHVIRLAYPAVQEGRQVLRTGLLRISATGKVEAKAGPTIVAEDPKGSVLQAVFVETDRADHALKADGDTALLYWMETVPSKGEMIARGALVSGPSGWSPTFDLSRAGGKRRSWKPDGEWLGDCMKGAFTTDGKTLRFVAQWPESSPPSIDLHVNVVSCKP